MRSELCKLKIYIRVFGWLLKTEITIVRLKLKDENNFFFLMSNNKSWKFTYTKIKYNL